MFWLYVGIVLAVVGGLWLWERGKERRVASLDPTVREQADRAAEQSHRRQFRDDFGGGGF